MKDNVNVTVVFTEPDSKSYTEVLLIPSVRKFVFEELDKIGCIYRLDKIENKEYIYLNDFPDERVRSIIKYCIQISKTLNNPKYEPSRFILVRFESFYGCHDFIMIRERYDILINNLRNDKVSFSTMQTTFGWMKRGQEMEIDLYIIYIDKLSENFIENYLKDFQNGPIITIGDC